MNPPDTDLIAEVERLLTAWKSDDDSLCAIDAATTLAETLGDRILAALRQGVTARAESEDANGVLVMIRDAMKQYGCSHESGTHDSTPPMMYPEWIMCAIAHHKKQAEAQRDELAKACRDFVEYTGAAKEYPWDRILSLFRAERARCRNPDDQDYWRFVEEKLVALVATVNKCG